MKPEVFPWVNCADMFDKTDADDAFRRAERIVAFAGEITKLAQGG